MVSGEELPLHPNPMTWERPRSGPNDHCAADRAEVSAAPWRFDTPWSLARVTLFNYITTHIDIYIYSTYIVISYPIHICTCLYMYDAHIDGTQLIADI